jgi:hypothetical protein
MKAIVNDQGMTLDYLGPQSELWLSLNGIPTLALTGGCAKKVILVMREIFKGSQRQVQNNGFAIRFVNGDANGDYANRLSEYLYLSPIPDKDGLIKFLAA